MHAAARWLNDAACVVLLAGGTWYWESHDGGRPLRPLVVVAIVCVLALPAALAEVRRLHRLGRLALVAWGLGLLLAGSLAVERSNFLEPTLTYAMTPVVFLAARRVWRRRWGPGVVVGLLLLGAGAYWHRSFLQWWGHAMSGEAPQWLALSWWNQSAVLMGMLGSLFLGLALVARRVVAAAGVLASAGLLSAVWLSGSRGGVLAVALATVVVVVVACWVRRAGEESIWPVLGLVTLVAVAAAALSWVLTGMTESGGQPLAQREQEAGDNAAARLHHMQAAIRMFADRPVSGYGPGSYEEVAPAFTSPEANLTSQAHNQYLQVFAEGGLVFGLPFLAGLVLVAGSPFYSPPPVRQRHADDLRVPAAVGAAGALTVLLTHSAIDFDWAFPVLPFVGAMSAAMLLPGGDEGEAPARRRSVALVPIAFVLVASAVLASTAVGPQIPVDPDPMELAGEGPGWKAPDQARYAEVLLLEGEVEAARVAVDRGLVWSPANDRLRVVAALVGHAEGNLTTPLLETLLEQPPTWMASYVTVARYLANAGEPDAAWRVAHRGLEVMREHAAWPVAHVAADAHVLLVSLAADRGCEEARGAAAGARADELVARLQGFVEVVADEVGRVCP